MLMNALAIIKEIQFRHNLLAS